MENKEISEGNKLIDAFMEHTGIVPFLEHGGGVSYIEVEKKYHSSWNDLMPVVEKIESMNVYFLTDTLRKGNVIDKYSCQFIDEFKNGGSKMIAPTRIESVWLGVISFLYWLVNLSGGFKQTKEK